MFTLREGFEKKMTYSRTNTYYIFVEIVEDKRLNRQSPNLSVRARSLDNPRLLDHGAPDVAELALVPSLMPSTCR